MLPAETLPPAPLVGARKVRSRCTAGVVDHERSTKCRARIILEIELIGRFPSKPAVTMCGMNGEPKWQDLAGNTRRPRWDARVVTSRMLLRCGLFAATGVGALMIFSPSAPALCSTLEFRDRIPLDRDTVDRSSLEAVNEVRLQTIPLGAGPFGFRLRLPPSRR